MIKHFEYVRVDNVYIHTELEYAVMVSSVNNHSVVTFLYDMATDAVGGGAKLSAWQPSEFMKYFRIADFEETSRILKGLDWWDG